MCLEMDRFEDQEDFKNFDDFCDHLLKVALYTHGNISEMEKDMIKRCYKSWIESKFDLEDKKIELAFFNTFQGMSLKGKIDMIAKKDGKIIVVDIKTIRSFKAIEENIKRYYYWFQTLYYKLLLSFEENGEFVDIVDDIYLIFLSKSEFGTRVLKFSDLNENEKTREFEEFKKIVKM